MLYLKNTDVNEILEIGDVLSHYVETGHLVVDKYEKGNQVINVDTLNFKPTKKFKTIISISTFEHIVFNEEGYAN